MHRLYVVRVPAWLSVDLVVAVSPQAAIKLVEATHGYAPGMASATLVRRGRMILWAKEPAMFPSRDQLRDRIG